MCLIYDLLRVRSAYFKRIVEMLGTSYLLSEHNYCLRAHLYDYAKLSLNYLCYQFITLLLLLRNTAIVFYYRYQREVYTKYEPERYNIVQFERKTRHGLSYHSITTDQYNNINNINNDDNNMMSSSMNYLQNTCLYTRVVYTHDNV